MKFFERFRKSVQPQPQVPQETGVQAEPSIERGKDFLDFGMEILEATDFPTEEKEEIKKSLRRKKRSGLYGGEHVTDHEADIFLGALKKDGRRPVEIIDLANTKNPFADLMEIRKKYFDGDGVRPKITPPILFLLNCDPQELDKLDSSFDFDRSARDLLQHRGWNIFLTGDMRFANYSGSIAVNFSTSHLKSEEDIKKRLEEKLRREAKDGN